MDKQQIPAGYKQTDVGVIPEDWELFILGNVATFSQGIQVGLEKQIKEEKKGYIKFLRIENYTQKSDDFRFVPKEEVKNKLVNEDDVVVVRYGATAGFIGIGIKGILANNLFKVDPEKKFLGKQFLFVFLKSDRVFKYFQDEMSGGAMPALSFKIVKNLLIPLPSLNEQTAIANALSDVDALIAALEKLIDKKSAIKTATMQQLLTGKKRLPPFDQLDAGYKQTELGEIPKDWEVISIDEAIDRKVILDQMDGNHGELYPKSHEFSDFGIPYVGATDFNNGRVNFNNCKYLPERRAKLFRKGIAKQGDVLFAHNATVGPVALLETNYEFIILSTTATYYRCNLDQINNKYLASYFSSSLFVNQYSAVMSQSTRNQVPILTQRKFKLILPNLKEQTAIANVLSDMDTELDALQQRLAKTQHIKQGMMQELLTGKTRLVTV